MKSHPLAIAASANLVAAGALLGLAFVSAERSELVLYSAVGLGLAVGICIVIQFVTPELLSALVVSVVYALQSLWMLVIAIGFPTWAPHNSHVADFMDVPVRATMPLLCVPAGALVAALVIRGICPRSALRRLAWSRVADHDGRRVYLYLGAAMLLLYWPAMTSDGGEAAGQFPLYFWPAYAIRILAGSFLPLAFFAGRVASADRKVSRVWTAAMLVNALIGLSLGHRGVALFPVVLFTVGYASSTYRANGLRTVLRLSAVGLLLLFLTGIVGLVRQDIPRAGLEVLSLNRLTEISGRATWVIARSELHRVMWTTVSRLLAWPNVTVAIDTPDAVPFRGMGGFSDEIWASAQLSSLTGRTREMVLDLGLSTAPATLYGFRVTPTTSVEFGLLADGWSRRGAVGAVMFGFVAVLILSAIELGSAATARWFGSSALLLLSVCMAHALQTTVYPLLSITRSTVFEAALVLALLSIVSLWGRGVGVRRWTQLRHAPPRQAWRPRTTSIASPDPGDGGTIGDLAWTGDDAMHPPGDIGVSGRRR